MKLNRVAPASEHLLTLLMLLAIGCADPADRSRDPGAELAPATSAHEAATPIINLAAFSEVVAEDDPFSDRPVMPAPCATWGLEGTYLEVNSGGCPYVTLSSLTLRALPAGALLTATFWHTPLTSPVEGVQAHIEISLGGLVLLAERVPIPAADAAYERATSLEQAVPEQTPLFIHVHNHGANAYRFTPVLATF